ncbi:N-acetylmuramoyl-L-alanine amidase family protein [Ascidiimonas sp. W6]|uniref:N-acetylmuramoyl-L-alanine amidase family protein n=1 Tax=Ascidiimonas meishanensis TaxID=3128903 RepID=UPI0030EC8B85
MKSYKIHILSIILTAVSFTNNGWCSPIQTQPGKKNFTVVLDAGHGGHDPGNLGNSYKEKDIALKIVLAVGAILEKETDINVVYTRKTDKFIDLYVRGKIANEANADLFVSVHCNSHGSEASGTETFVLGLHANRQNFEVAKAENSVIYLEEDYETNYAGYNINSPESFIALTIVQEEFLDQSIMLAKNIQSNFTKKLKRKNRGVKQAGFIVLHQTFMPSVLVEVGFLTHKPEGRYLNSASGQVEIAGSISKGILAYKKSVGENVGNDFSFESQNNEVTPETSITVIDSITKQIENKKDQNPKLVLTYKIQIAAGASKLELIPANFRGLRNLSRESYQDIYRYLFGETNSFSKAQELQQEAVKAGYTSAFIVGYRNGKRTSLSEVSKSASN